MHSSTNASSIDHYCKTKLYECMNAVIKEKKSPSLIQSPDTTWQKNKWLADLLRNGWQTKTDHLKINIKTIRQLQVSCGPGFLPHHSTLLLYTFLFRFFLDLSDCNTFSEAGGVIVQGTWWLLGKYYDALSKWELIDRCFWVESMNVWRYVQPRCLPTILPIPRLP